MGSKTTSTAALESNNELVMRLRIMLVDVWESYHCVYCDVAMMSQQIRRKSGTRPLGTWPRKIMKKIMPDKISRFN